MRTIRTLLMAVALAVPAPSAAAATYTENFENYSIGALNGQNGWSKTSGSGRADVYADNGPTIAGSKCVLLDNLSGSWITLRKSISDLVATDKILAIQYDVKNVTNHSGKYPTTFRVRVYDSATGYAAIGNMHYDGGGDPASQAWANNGTTNAWAPGGPAWSDTGWHNVIWRLNYATREFVSITFDAAQYPQPGWYFAYNATKADLMEIYLSGPDGSNDIWEIDNIVLTSYPVPAPLSIAAAKSLVDGAGATLQAVVSAVFPGYSPQRFYIQQSSPSRCGIQVRASGALPAVNQTVSVTGEMATDPTTRERYISAPTGCQVTGSGTVKPICMNTRALGGGAMGIQKGVYQGQGLNNVGLLVKVCGKVTGKAADGSYLYVSDGSAVDDGGSPGAKVDLSAIAQVMRPESAVGNNVVIEGVCSMYALGGNAHRMIKVRSTVDFTNYSLKIFKVIVLNFDPVVPSVGKRTHEALGWNDPRPHALNYMNDLKEMSACWAQYRIVEWHDIDYHAHFTDGFQYTAQQYYDKWRSCGSGCSDWHQGTADYYKIINDFGIAPRVASGEIDEVLMFGSPCGSAFWEAAMAGTTPYFINGDHCHVPAAGRNFTIMGFNYEREVGCMLEDFCHRSECIMSHVYGRPLWDLWIPKWPPADNWDRFRMYDKIKSGEAALGICHYAPNSQKDYEWGNTTYVWSHCDDWLYNWPNLQGIKRWVNCAEWGNGDMRLHHLWWLKHFPRKPGVNPDAKQNNWWKYLVDYNSYPESR